MSVIAKQVGNYVEYRINSFVNSGNDSAVKAMLAQLRRGAGKHPSVNPAVWEAAFKNLPQELYGASSDLSYAEIAIQLTLTLFAIHQQSKDLRSELMHESGISIGTALGLLVKAKGKDSYNSIKKRFDKIITADSLDELSNHLRGAVKLLRSNGISLDYQMLSMQLYNYQYVDSREAIQLSWARDFFSTVSKKETQESKTDE